jgi:hypothetical protein
VSAFDAAQSVPSLPEALASATSAAEGANPAEMLVEALRSDDRRNPALRSQALWLLARIHGGRGHHREEHELLVELATLSDEMGSPG